MQIMPKTQFRSSFKQIIYFFNERIVFIQQVIHTVFPLISAGPQISAAPHSFKILYKPRAVIRRNTVYILYRISYMYIYIEHMSKQNQ